MCQGGVACITRHTRAYAHSREELLKPQDNVLLMEVAHEWQSHGVPREWEHLLTEPAAPSRAEPPAARTVVVAQRRSKDVNPMAPPRRSTDPNPMAPRAAVASWSPPSSQPLSRQMQVRPQELPPSMLNEDLEVEDSLMDLIVVRHS